MFSAETPLVKLRPKSDTLYISQGRAVLATDLDGFVLNDQKAHGFIVAETRVLSKYFYEINGEHPHPNVLSNVDQHSWLGYYTTSALDIFKNQKKGDEGSGQMTDESEKTLEMRVSRTVGGGIHEDIDFTNYTGQIVQFEFAITADADFSDQMEIGKDRRQMGVKSTLWSSEGQISEMRFTYEAEHSFFHQGYSGYSKIKRGLRLRFRNYPSPPRRRDEKIYFSISLKPFETWHCCVEMIPQIGNEETVPAYQCRAFKNPQNHYEILRKDFLETSTDFRTSHGSDLSSVVLGSLIQAKYDLASMRLYDLDTNSKAWTTAAGLPIYTALFGRDTMTSSWQASMVGPEMIRGTLAVHKNFQGTQVNDWLDEQPGRMIHEVHTGPLAELRYNPLGLNYGSTTSSMLYPFLVSQLWHWTGDKEQVEPFIEPALKALQWMEKYGDLDGDGFYEYKTRSHQGVVNQGWKDSASAIVYDDGSLVEPPIAMSEEQAFAYAAKYFFAETLWWMGRKDEAKQIFRQAKELKKHFNDKFWNEELGFLAMALDSKKNQVCSIGSDAGHCLVSGILDESLVPRVANRMFEEDLFSGWGIRTLSSRHPSYNPYSYHRGSVWPVENGTFCLALTRYGLHSHTEKLARAFFETANLYDFNRLPEVLSGHPRNEEHPFPALYPRSNSPQAWSASATFLVLQSLLGLYPYAPLGILIVDPHLPEWLPEIQISRLHVGSAEVQIYFYRKPDGSSHFKVLNQKGKLRIIRQPSPWSQVATAGERIKDLFESYI